MDSPERGNRRDLLSKGGRREGRRGVGREKRKERRTRGTGKSRWKKDREGERGKGSLAEGAMMGLVRTLALGKSPGIHTHDPS